MAVFVMDEGHRHLGGAQHVQRVHRVHPVGHDRRRPHQRAQIERPPLDEGGDDVARLDDADQLVDRAFRHRQPAVRGVEQRPADRLRVGVDVDPVDVGARRHHLAGRPVGEPDHAGDDRPLALLDHAGAGRLGDDEMQLLGGHLVEDSRRRRSSRKISALVRSSSQTNGAVALAIHSIGSAITTAIGSGARSANCLGTSSPITSEA